MNELAGIEVLASSKKIMLVFVSDILPTYSQFAANGEPNAWLLDVGVVVVAV